MRWITGTRKQVLAALALVDVALRLPRSAGGVATARYAEPAALQSGLWCAPLKDAHEINVAASGATIVARLPELVRLNPASLLRLPARYRGLAAAELPDEFEI